MTTNEIKTAVDQGLTVHWKSKNYRVINDPKAGYLIKSENNENYIALTWKDGKTLNGQEYGFYIDGKQKTATRVTLTAITYRCDDEGGIDTILYCEDGETGKLYCQLTREQLKAVTQKTIIAECRVWDNYSNGVRFNLNSLYMEEIEPIKSVYERRQHYGGDEEGGWYYHTLMLSKITREQEEAGLDTHGNGIVYYDELIQGMNEDLDRQYYS